MDYRKTAEDILRYVGGESNVSHLEHCSTRLRFTLVDSKKADIEALKAVKGVMGVIMTAQCQVVIGNDVIEVFNELNKIATFNGDQTPAMSGGEKRKPGAVILDFIVGVFQPLIPAIAGAGILKALLSLFVLFHWMEESSVVYKTLFYAADAALYFLPLMVAITTAAKLKINKLVALSAVGALILPGMTTMISEGATLFGMNIKAIQYTYQVFPAILSVLFLAAVEKLATKISPKPIRVFFVPLLCFVIVVPVTLLLLGPLGFTIGEGLTDIILTLYKHLGWIAVAILAAILPFMIATGMHKALVPYAVSSITNSGEELLYMPASLAHNISEGGACFAVAIRTKDTELRSAAISAGISAIFGITEPALYGVTLQKKRVLSGVVIGSFVGGLVVGLAAVKAFVAMGPGLAGMAMFVDKENAMNIVWAGVGFGVSVAVSFIATLILYRDDDVRPQEEVQTLREANISAAETVNIIDLTAPVNGTLIPVEEVNDEVFSAGILGKGVGIIPADGKIFAPADGIIDSVFETNHAITLMAENGGEILIHVGLDTVNLKGKGFKPAVKAGDRVKAGELIMEVNLEQIRSAGFDPTVIMVVTNSDEFNISAESGKTVRKGDKVMKMEAV